MGILFPLGKEVLPLINQAEVCLLLQRTTANKALRKGGVVRAYLFKKKKNLQVLLLHVLRLVRMGGRPCSAERDLLPITLWHCWERGILYTIAAAGLHQGCSKYRFGASTLHPAWPRHHPPHVLHSSSYNSNNFPFFSLYTQVMSTWGTKHLRGCFKPFAPCSWSLSDQQNLPPSHRCIILLAVTMWFGPHKYLWAPPHPLICSLKELVRIAAA